MTPPAAKKMPAKTPAKKSAAIWDKASTRPSTAPVDGEPENGAQDAQEAATEPQTEAELDKAADSPGEPSQALTGDVIPAGMLRLPSGRLTRIPTKPRTYLMPLDVIDLIDTVVEEAFNSGEKLARQDVVASAVRQVYGHLLDKQ